MSEPHPGQTLGKVAVISLEPWDEVWRRNQHIAFRLVTLGLADHVTFVNPATRSGGDPHHPAPGITVVSPRRSIPKRLGGLRTVAHSLRREFVSACDTLWINDPTTGAFLTPHDRAVYDVTDDWRTADLSDRERRRLVAAEDMLAHRSLIVVCSGELKKRWRQRYEVDAVIVKNAVDVTLIQRAQARNLGTEGPHVGYIGTLHDERLDVKLVLFTADALTHGTVHLVGPDSLSVASRAALASHPRVALHPTVPASEVPNWLVAFDVLISPHRVNDFTLSLDAIKSYEYLATDRPVVATPTSGFQDLSAPGLIVCTDTFVAEVLEATHRSEVFHRTVADWNDRTREFALALTQGAAHE